MVKVRRIIHPQQLYSHHPFFAQAQLTSLNRFTHSHSLSLFFPSVGNMLNLDAGTIKRKIDSNEYDDEIIQEIQVKTRPKRATSCCISLNLLHSLKTISSIVPLTPSFLLYNISLAKWKENMQPHEPLPLQQLWNADPNNP